MTIEEMGRSEQSKELQQRIDQLQRENSRLKAQSLSAFRYVRAKVDQLLKIMGTLPLRSEELDNDTLIALDPIGIIGESFSQVIEHLHSTNAELMMARDELHAIFNAAGSAILVVDQQQHLHSCNPEAVEQFSIQLEEGYGQPLSAVIPDCSRLIPQDLFQNIVRSDGQVFEQEISFGAFHYNLLASAVSSSGTTPDFYVLVFNDVTEQKNIEKSLLEAEIRLTGILNTMMAGILIIDPETHRIVDVNHMAVQLIGDSRDKIIGSVCHQYICPSQQGQCPLMDLHQVIDNSDRILLTADKQEIPVLKTATIIELSGKRYILESFIDIQARKAAEQALRESEQRYRSLYAAMKEGVAIGEVLYNKHGVPNDYLLHDVNQAFASMLGSTVEELSGKRASDLYHKPVISHLDVLTDVVTTGKAIEYEMRVRQLKKVFKVSVTRPEAGRFAAIINDITSSKKAQKEIERLAYYDTLTGLPNRVLIKDRLQQAMAQADRSLGVVGVLALDLDHFKKINDSLGVGCGDQMLKIVAERLKRHLRHGDTVARMGGDEFVIVLTGSQSQEDIVVAAGKILDLFTESVAIDDHDIVCTASLGIATYPMDSNDVDLLLKHADTAMYHAKETGRNLYQFFSPDMNERAFERLFLDSDLHRAIQRDELEVYYQPQINLADGRVVGAEALLRWNHGEKGQISPALFIPLAEESDLILDIGRWVLQRACEQTRIWNEGGGA